MSRIILRALVAAVGLVAVTAGVGYAAIPASNGTISANQSPLTSNQQRSALLDPCLLVQADATLWLGAGIPAVEASHAGGFGGDSPSYGYWQRPCRNFIVDVQVPVDSGAPGFHPAFSITAQSSWNRDNCDIYEEWTSVYKKRQGQSTYSLLGHTLFFGHQKDGVCTLVITDDSEAWPATFAPPTTGRATTYRIVSGAGYEAQFPGYYWENRTVRAAHLPVL